MPYWVLCGWKQGCEGTDCTNHVIFTTFKTVGTEFLSTGRLLERCFINLTICKLLSIDTYQHWTRVLLSIKASFSVILKLTVTLYYSEQFSLLTSCLLACWSQEVFYTNTYMVHIFIQSTVKLTWHYKHSFKTGKIWCNCCMRENYSLWKHKFEVPSH